MVDYEGQDPIVLAKSMVELVLGLCSTKEDLKPFINSFVLEYKKGLSIYAGIDPIRTEMYRIACNKLNDIYNSLKPGEIIKQDS